MVFFPFFSFPTCQRSSDRAAEIMTIYYFYFYFFKKRYVKIMDLAGINQARAAEIITILCFKKFDLLFSFSKKRYVKIMDLSGIKLGQLPWIRRCQPNSTRVANVLLMCC